MDAAYSCLVSARSISADTCHLHLDNRKYFDIRGAKKCLLWQLSTEFHVSVNDTTSHSPSNQELIKNITKWFLSLSLWNLSDLVPQLSLTGPLTYITVIYSNRPACLQSFLLQSIGHIAIILIWPCFLWASSRFSLKIRLSTLLCLPISGMAVKVIEAKLN